MLYLEFLRKNMFFKQVKYARRYDDMICLAVDFPSVPRNTSPNGGLSIVVWMLDMSNSVNGFKIPQCQSRWLASRIDFS